MKKFFRFKKITLSLAAVILSTKIFAGGAVTFSPSEVTCAPAGCGPVTITNNTGKTVAFAGVAVAYNDPNRPTTSFSYTYTGCSGGLVATGTTCDVVINPVGFTLVAGSYAVRPLFYRTSANYSSDPNTLAVGISFVVNESLDCVADNQCTTNPSINCCSNSCVDLILDTNNCGSCGTVCSVGTTPSCCASGCIDLDNDINNCGSCGTVCSAGTNPACCASGCVDLDNDNNNCGSCGNACNVGGGEACNGAGVCAVPPPLA